MKICSWIDQFFDTYTKRRSWLKAILCLWLIYQTGRLVPLLTAMVKVSDYDQLFALQSSLQNFQDLYLIRVILKVLYESSHNVFGVIISAIQCIPVSGWIMMAVAAFLVLGSSNKKKIMFFMDVMAAAVALVLIAMLFMLRASSLGILIFWVRLVGVAGLIFACIFLCTVGWTFVSDLCNIF